MENSNKKGNKTKRKRSKSVNNLETQVNQITSEQEHSPKKFPKLKNSEETQPVKKHKSKKNKSQINNAAVSNKTEKKSSDKVSTKNKENPVVPNAKHKKTKNKKVNKSDVSENIDNGNSESSESEEEILINKEFQSKDAEGNTEVEVTESSKKEKKVENPNWNDPKIKAELNTRTLFVGNVATTIKKVQLLKFFGKFGKVHSVRIRCVTPIHPGVSKRVAVIKKMLHPKRATLHCYVTFEKREDALKALSVNGTQYKGHHLRVQMCDETEKPDSKKAIFVGNLPFDAEDDELWAALECCGTIKSVRIIRNAGTGMGIGIGYVNFESSDAVELALQMENVKVKNKEIRIKPYQEKKSKEKNNRQVKPESRNSSKALGQVKEKGKPKDEKNKPFLVTVKKTAFQGAKSSQKKKKRKVNKGFLQKMKMSQKIAPKSAN